MFMLAGDAGCAACHPYVDCPSWGRHEGCLTLAGILVLLHDLVMLGLFLGTLFRSQQGVYIPTWP